MTKVPQSLQFLLLSALLLTGSGLFEDEGDRWEVITLPTNAILYGLHFLDANNGYFCGGVSITKSGLIGRTGDGGKVWELVVSVADEE
jgi:photosystem II stability/assembly factor-like uncharacterized protein